jgi:hypothetical protein
VVGPLLQQHRRQRDWFRRLQDEFSLTSAAVSHFIPDMRGRAAGMLSHPEVTRSTSVFLTTAATTTFRLVLSCPTGISLPTSSPADAAVSGTPTATGPTRNLIGETGQAGGEQITVASYPDIRNVRRARRGQARAGQVIGSSAR